MDCVVANKPKVRAQEIKKFQVSKLVLWVEPLIQFILLT